MCDDKKSSELFADSVRTTDMVDLPLLGRNFTWTNKRDNPFFARMDIF